MNIQKTNKLLDEAVDELGEAMWSAGVETKWHPPEGFFKQSASKIAAGLKKASKDLKQAQNRLSFYINRAGENLSDEDMDRLKTAKSKLQKMYT